MTTADEESSNGTEFILKLKQRWGEQYPEQKAISKQNRRDKTANFKKELKWNVRSKKTKIEKEQDTILNNTKKLKTEMKVNLLKIDERERIAVEDL